MAINSILWQFCGVGIFYINELTISIKWSRSTESTAIVELFLSHNRHNIFCYWSMKFFLWNNKSSVGEKRIFQLLVSVFLKLMEKISVFWGAHGNCFSIMRSSWQLFQYYEELMTIISVLLRAHGNNFSIMRSSWQLFQYYEELMTIISVLWGAHDNNFSIITSSWQ